MTYLSLECLCCWLYTTLYTDDNVDHLCDIVDEILKANDTVMQVMTLYKKKVEGVTEENGIISFDSPKNDGG